MTLKALKTRCIIQKIETEKKSASGLILQNDTDNNPRAEIVSIGSGVVSDLKIGDRVVVDWRRVGQITDQDQKFYVIDEVDIVAVEEN